MNSVKNTFLSILLNLGFLIPVLTFSQTVPEQADNSITSKPDLYGRKNARVHDPSSIIKHGDTYWFFSTGRGVRSWSSKDLNHWEPGPAVMPEMPDWVKEVVPDQRGHYWAPDVIHLNGKYLVYYSVSSFGKNTSAIALASSKTLDPNSPDFEWKDEGIVIQSNRQDRFNAIDPAIIQTSDDEIWMSFGSFWSGLKLFQLDPETGKRLNPEVDLVSIASYKAIEAPHIYEHDGWFYLFVNWDVCCRGIESTYNIRVGRSKKITGPYLDKEGKDLREAGGSLLIQSDPPFIGPGHANIFKTEAGKFLFSFHFYDGTRRGAPTLGMLPLEWDCDGWPVLLDTEGGHVKPELKVDSNQ